MGYHSGVVPTNDSGPRGETVRVNRYAVFEHTFTLDSSGYSNPWEDVNVAVTFVTPSGQTIPVGGFYYEPHTWKVRLAPWEVGRWQWSAVMTDGVQRLEFSGSFDSVDTGQPGFVRRHPTTPFRLVFENGALYPAIGIGDCILDFDRSGSPLDEWGLDGDFRPLGQEQGWTTDIDTYMSAYGGAGFNLFRWSVDNCAFKMWDAIAPQGNRYLVQEGQWGDELVRKLRDYGLRVYLVLFGFNPAFGHGAGDPARMDAVKRYVKYMVDRYGAYADFWELMNEASVSDAWYTVVANYIRSVDPYQHMISTSWERPGHPSIDITSPHWYQRENEFQSDEVTAQRIAGWRGHAKPILFGEQGNTGQNWDERSALRMRLRSWSAFFNEGMLIFWNTSFAKDYRNPSAANLYLGPEERQSIRVLQAFTQGVDPDVVRAPVAVSDSNRVRGYGLRSSGLFAAYLHNFRDHADPTTGITITVDLPAAGVAYWFLPSTGEVVSGVPVGDGLRTLNVPPFVVDVALGVVP